jgi:hypothetical protein
MTDILCPDCIENPDKKKGVITTRDPPFEFKVLYLLDSVVQQQKRFDVVRCVECYDGVYIAIDQGRRHIDHG